VLPQSSLKAGLSDQSTQRVQTLDCVLPSLDRVEFRNGRECLVVENKWHIQRLATVTSGTLGINCVIPTALSILLQSLERSHCMR
jgi:hypothetical protein